MERYLDRELKRVNYFAVRWKIRQQELEQLQVRACPPIPPPVRLVLTSSGKGHGGRNRKVRDTHTSAPVMSVCRTCKAAEAGMY